MGSESSNIFDSVFKTIFHKMPQLVIPLLNEAFGRDYAPEEPAKLMRNDFKEVLGLRIADAIIEVSGKLYHVECQSTRDSAMAFRMFEYDLAIALAGATRVADGSYKVSFPESCVVFLRGSNGKHPKVSVELPSGEEFCYESKAVYLEDYSDEAIFQKDLLALYPFLPLRFEHALRHGNLESETLVSECCKLSTMLQEHLADGRESLASPVTDLTLQVLDYVLRDCADLRRKARTAMGGEVLELIDERMERMAREAAREAARKAAREAEKKGYDQGKEDARSMIAEKLKLLGIDDVTIAEATSC